MSFVLVQRPGRTETADGYKVELLASLRATGLPSHIKLRAHNSELSATRSLQGPMCCRTLGSVCKCEAHHVKHPAAPVSAHPCLCPRPPRSSKQQIPHTMLVNTLSQYPVQRTARTYNSLYGLSHRLVPLVAYAVNRTVN